MQNSETPVVSQSIFIIISQRTFSSYGNNIFSPNNICDKISISIHFHNTFATQIHCMKKKICNHLHKLCNIYILYIRWMPLLNTKQLMLRLIESLTHDRKNISLTVLTHILYYKNSVSYRNKYKRSFEYITLTKKAKMFKNAFKRISASLRNLKFKCLRFMACIIKHILTRPIPNSVWSGWWN